ncbi:hypothetical protein LINPERHAP2_LOCUS26033 [Linum perenne]
MGTDGDGGGDVCPNHQITSPELHCRLSTAHRHHQRRSSFPSRRRLGYDDPRWSQQIQMTFSPIKITILCNITIILCEIGMERRRKNKIEAPAISLSPVAGAPESRHLPSPVAEPEPKPEPELLNLSPEKNMC